MERFWTLKYLQQEEVCVLEASLVKEMAGGTWLVRADRLPLMLNVMGAAGLMRGDKVKVELGQIGLMALDVSGTVIEKISSLQTHPAVGLDPQEAMQEIDDMEEMEATASGPIAIAMNVNESVADDAAAV